MVKSTIGARSELQQFEWTGAQIAAPKPLQVGFPITIACGVNVYASANLSAAGPLFGLSYNSTVTAPYIAISAALDATDGYFMEIDWNSAGTQGSAVASPLTTPTAGADYVLAVAIAAASQVGYVNGAPIVSATNALSNPTYGTGPFFYVGSNSAFEQNNGLLYYWFAAWNRGLTTAEHLFIGSGPNAIWQMFQAPGTWWPATLPVTAAGSAYYPGFAALRPAERLRPRDRHFSRLYW